MSTTTAPAVPKPVSAIMARFKTNNNQTANSTLPPAIPGPPSSLLAMPPPVRNFGSAATPLPGDPGRVPSETVSRLIDMLFTTDPRVADLFADAAAACRASFPDAVARATAPATSPHPSDTALPTAPTQQTAASTDKGIDTSGWTPSALTTGDAEMAVPNASLAELHNAVNGDQHEAEQPVPSTGVAVAAETSAPSSGKKRSRSKSDKKKADDENDEADEEEEKPVAKEKKPTPPRSRKPAAPKPVAAAAAVVQAEPSAPKRPKTDAHSELNGQSVDEQEVRAFRETVPPLARVQLAKVIMRMDTGVQRDIDINGLLGMCRTENDIVKVLGLVNQRFAVQMLRPLVEREIVRILQDPNYFNSNEADPLEAAIQDIKKKLASAHPKN